MEKRFKVIDLKTDSDIFGSDMPLQSLVTVYPMAPLKDEKPFDALELHESAMAETATPTRGRGVYKVVRVQ